MTQLRVIRNLSDSLGRGYDMYIRVETCSDSVFIFKKYTSLYSGNPSDEVFKEASLDFDDIRAIVKFWNDYGDFEADEKNRVPDEEFKKVFPKIDEKTFC